MKRTLFVALVGLVFGLAAMAEVITPGDFDKRIRIRFPGYEGDSALTNFPVEVVFKDGLQNFSFADFESDDWSDLRFTSSDETSAVPYEVESWNNKAVIPTNIAGCSLWLSADYGVQTNGSGGVTNWLDRSGTGHNALQYYDSAASNLVDVPLYATNVLNGQPALVYDGTKKTLVCDSTLTARTIFIVTRVATNIVALGGVFCHAYGQDSSNVRAQTPTTWNAPGYNANTADFCNNGEVWINGYETYTHDENAHILYEVSGVNITGLRCQFGQTFAPGGVGRYYNGDLYEVIIYDRTLTEEERNVVGKYLSEKYGISAYYPYPRRATVWVQVPELTTNTVLYAYYGNSTLTNIPAYSTNGTVWDSNYAGVWHMGSITRNGYFDDATANRNDGVNGTGANEATYSAGQIYHGSEFNFNGGNWDYVTLPDSTHDFSGPFSVSLWVQPYWFNTLKNLIGKDKNSPQFAFVLYIDTKKKLNIASKNGTQSTVTSTNAVFESYKWHHVAATVDSNSIARLYVNGEKVGEGLLENRNDLGSFRLGRTPDGWWGGLEGLMDEPRISKNVRSADWIKASYQSQEDPESFTALEVDRWWDTSDGAGLQAGSGTWNSSNVFWSASETGSASRVAWGSGLLARFTAEDTISTITVEDVIAQGLLFEGAGYTLTNGTIAVGSSGITAEKDVSIGSAIEMQSDQDWSVASSNTLTVSGVISGTGGITKEGEGTLDLKKAATFTGGMVVNGGSVLLDCAKYAQSLRKYKTVEINAGTVTAVRVNVVDDVPFRIHSGGSLVCNGKHEHLSKPVLLGGIIASTGSGKYHSQDFMLDDILYVEGTEPSRIIVENGVGILNTRTFEVADVTGDDETDLLVTSVIREESAGSKLLKTGAGTMKLTEDSVYSGGTEIQGGALLVANTSGSGTGTGDVTLNGGTLCGTGTVAGAVSCGVNGGTFAPGYHGGTLTCQSNLDLSLPTNAVAVATNYFEVNAAVDVGGSVVYGSAAVDGDIILSNAVLRLNTNYEVRKNERFFVIINNGTNAVQGTFAGLPQGGVLEAVDSTGTTNKFYVSYTGNHNTGRTDGGKDVVIVYRQEPGLLLIVH